MTSAPGKGAREIERKFLVAEMPPNLAEFAHRDIEQGYLAIAADGVQVRLRKAGEKHTLTFKRGRANAREEREVEISPGQFAVLWPGTEGKRLAKTRYDVPLGDHTVEIDIYSGRHSGLIVAEVEFEDEQTASAFEPPSWLGADVTHDARYSNQLLACEAEQPSAAPPSHT
jgi:CYTH domain-containing protein